MKVGYFDCFSGISGDMALAALLDAGLPLEVLKEAFAPLGLPIQFQTELVKRCGLEGLKLHVEAPVETQSRYLPDILELLDRISVSPRAKELASLMFGNLARAEARAHGIEVEKVHFHEVGALDSIADIFGVAIGVDFLGLKRVHFSPIPTGSGSVKCEHGLMPVPTPATAFLLEGIPLAPSPASGELTTPTGATIAKTLADEFGTLPPMTVTRVGCGAGTKTFLSHPNMVRLFVGEMAAIEGTEPARDRETDQVTLLQTNLDDQTPEAIGFLMEQVMGAGALDAWVTPILMKKGRPAHELSILAGRDTWQALEGLLFQQTRTLGVRRVMMDRTKLPRSLHEVETPFGKVRGKVRLLDGSSSFHPEFEDCARLARQRGVTLQEVQRAAHQAYASGND